MQRRALIGAAIVAAVCGLQAADRPEITFADGRIFPESLTSTKNGTLYFGSLGQDSVYRATAEGVEGRDAGFSRSRTACRPCSACSRTNPPARSGSARRPAAGAAARRSSAKRR